MRYNVIYEEPKEVQVGLWTRTEMVEIQEEFSTKDKAIAQARLARELEYENIRIIDNTNKKSISF